MLGDHDAATCRGTKELMKRYNERYSMDYCAPI
jgi:hypothetical protein